MQIAETSRRTSRGPSAHTDRVVVSGVAGLTVVVHTVWVSVTVAWTVAAALFARLRRT